MTTFVDISAGLDGHLNTMVSVPSYVAFENEGETDSVLGTLWLRATNLQGDTNIMTQGVTVGKELTIGVYQIDIFAESGKGKNESIVMADTIADRFKTDTEITYNSRLIRIINVNKLVGRNNKDGWYQTPVEIIYNAHTLRR